MKTLRISCHIESGILQMRLNSAVIAINNTMYEQELARGEYILQWYAEGVAYTTFGITISSPAVAEFQLLRKLDLTGKDFGGFRFTV